MNSDRTKDLASGACFLALGLFIAFRSVGYRLWGGIGPQEGLFPFILGVLMIGLSAVVIARAVLSGLASTATEHKQPANEEKTGPGNVLKAVFYAVLMGCYAILLQPVGFLITTTVFLVFILKIVERQSWKIAVSVTLGLTALSYILFAYLLTVPLPRGLLN